MKHVAVRDWCLRPDEIGNFRRNHLEVDVTLDVFDLNALDMVIARQCSKTPNGVLSFLNDLFSNHSSVVRVIHNGPATILFWEDGVKTVVKLQDGDKNDPEKAVMAGMLKRLYPNWQDVIRGKKTKIEAMQ